MQFKTPFSELSYGKGHLYIKTPVLSLRELKTNDKLKLTSFLLENREEKTLNYLIGFYNSVNILQSDGVAI